MMPLVWGTVLLSNVFSRAATPNSFRSRSSKADSARHRGTNYVIKDQQLQEIGWPKEPTCRGAFARYLSVYTALLSVLCNAVLKPFGRSVMGSFSVQWVFLPDLISSCLKVFPNVIKKKIDEITAFPISLPQTALSSLSIICNNADLRHVWVWLVLCPYFAEEPLKRNTSRRNHLKNISEVQR